MDQLNCNFVCSLFPEPNIHSTKIIKFWQINIAISKINKTQWCPLMAICDFASTNTKYVCACSNANPLHYYMLWVLHKADKWH